MNKENQFHIQSNIDDKIGFVPPQDLQQDFASSPTKITTQKNFGVRDSVLVDENEIKMLKGQKINRRAFSTVLSGSLYSVLTTDFLLGITNLSYAPSIGLPSPLLAGLGKTYIIKDEAGGAATTTITIRSFGDANIDGSSSATLTTNYQSKSFYSDGTQWFVF